MTGGKSVVSALITTLATSEENDAMILNRPKIILGRFHCTKKTVFLTPRYQKVSCFLKRACEKHRILRWFCVNLTPKWNENGAKMASRWCQDGAMLARLGALGRYLGSSWRSCAPFCRQVVARWRQDGPTYRQNEPGCATIAQGRAERGPSPLYPGPEDPPKGHAWENKEKRDSPNRIDIHIHIRIQLHTYTDTHIHKYTYTHTYTHIHTYTHTHIHTYTYTYTHTHIHTYTDTQIHTYTHTHIHTYTHTCTNTHTYISTYTNACACTYKYARIHIHIIIHIHIRIHIHIHIHTPIHRMIFSSQP